MDTRRETATLGGGCFWCLEAVYDDLRGVESVVSGYAGGHVANPSYDAVCAGTTGHAEVVQVTFDPQQVSFQELLQVFFVIHDPTTLNRQGNDVGSQYRSAIFYHDDEQQRIAEKVKARVEQSGAWKALLIRSSRAQHRDPVAQTQMKTPHFPGPQSRWPRSPDRVPPKQKLHSSHRK